MDATPIIIKRKKAAHAAHHGGSWKVAYADFVTAMMAFFMVMWIMGLSEDTKAQIQGYFNDPIGFAKTTPRSKTVIPMKGQPNTKPGQNARHLNQPYQDEQRAINELKNQMKKALESSPELKELLKQVDFKITDEGLRIEFLDGKDAFFESGEAILKPAAVSLIHRIGPYLAKAGRIMTIEGHTDAVQYAGDPLGNYGLSGRRAFAVADELGKTGVKPKQLKSVSALADTQLRDAAHPASSANRRVSIMLPFETPATAKIVMPKDEIRKQISGTIVPGIHVAPDKPDVIDKK